MVQSGTTYRLITDQVGSVRLVVDTATGLIAERLDYDEFGRVLQDTNPGFQPFGFRALCHPGNVRQLAVQIKSALFTPGYAAGSRPGVLAPALRRAQNWAGPAGHPIIPPLRRRS